MSDELELLSFSSLFIGKGCSTAGAVWRGDELYSFSSLFIGKGCSTV